MRFHFSKLKVRLSVVLWSIFMLVVIVEGLVLYKSLYLNPKNAALVREREVAPVFTKINFQDFNEVTELLNKREEYQLPDYQLQQGGLGRENPFVEYR